ncbi:MAG: GTP 3',8-cyclase MoaA [Planctomycetota bacterium]
MLIDRFGRQHTSLRVSVTDRCNLRCTYCMPAESPDYCDRLSILSFEEITRVVRIASQLGVTDVRLTGGEPLVRSQLHGLVGLLSPVPGIRKVTLTTNGLLLADQLSALREAGLHSVNVSLDALDESSFSSITRRNGLSKVLRAISACRQLRVPVKVNAIAMKHFTEDQIESFGEFARSTGIPVRFIEFMPLDADGEWDDDAVLSGQRILDLFRDRVRPLVPLGDAANSPSREYTFDDGIGVIGIIASVTEPFCHSCNRFRLTADGQIRSCLFGEDSADLKHSLRNGRDDIFIANQIRSAVMDKPRGHGTDDMTFKRPSRPMYAIGG